MMRTHLTCLIALLAIGCGDDPPGGYNNGAGPGNGGRRIIINQGGSTADGGAAPQSDSGYYLPDSPPPQADLTPPAPDTGPPPPSCGHNSMEDQVFKLLNQRRAQSGLQALACDAAAVRASRDFSQLMCDKKFFSHYGPGGSTVSSRLKAAGAQFSYAGENIAYGYSTPQKVHTGWMNSYGHRKNMLSKSWSRVGIGYVLCNGSRAYWTEDFLN